MTRQLLDGNITINIQPLNLRDKIISMIKKTVDMLVDLNIDTDENHENQDYINLDDSLQTRFHKSISSLAGDDYNNLAIAALKEQLYNGIITLYEQREDKFTSKNMRKMERNIMLRVISSKWSSHINNLDIIWNDLIYNPSLKKKIADYKSKSLEAFDQMNEDIEFEVVYDLFNAPISSQTDMIQETTDDEQEKIQVKFWKVTGESTVYLLGSIHAADESIYPLHDSIEEAFEFSGNLAVEADIINYEFNETDKYLMMEMAYIYKGASIKDYISEEAFEKYKTMYESLKPYLVELGILYWDYMHRMPWSMYLSHNQPHCGKIHSGK